MPRSDAPKDDNGHRANSPVVLVLALVVVLGFCFEDEHEDDDEDDFQESHSCRAAAPLRMKMWEGPSGPRLHGTDFIGSPVGAGLPLS